MILYYLIKIVIIINFAKKLIDWLICEMITSVPSVSYTSIPVRWYSKNYFQSEVLCYGYNINIDVFLDPKIMPFVLEVDITFLNQYSLYLLEEKEACPLHW